MTEESTVLEQPAEASEELSLAEELKKTFDELQKKEEGTEPEPAPETASTETGEDTTEEVATEVEGSPETEEVEAPQHWSAKDREEFSKIPSEGRELVLRRYKEMEADYTRKTQRLAEESRSSRELEKVFEPYEQVLALNGVDKSALLKQYLAIDANMGKDPEGTLKWLAQQRGIDLNSLAGAEETYVEPEIAEIRKHYQEFRQEISNIRNDLNQVKTVPISQQVELFAGEKDASGNLKRPFFNEVRTQMGVFMQNGLANSLEDAYEQAVWANPATRQKFSQEANRAAVLKKQQEERERASKAKNASSHIKSGGVETRTGGADLSQLGLAEHLKQVAKDMGYES